MKSENKHISQGLSFSVTNSVHHDWLYLGGLVLYSAMLLIIPNLPGTAGGGDLMLISECSLSNCPAEDYSRLRCKINVDEHITLIFTLIHIMKLTSLQQHYAHNKYLWWN